jgi:outer membrane protein OmpA-like peptidoglycan-associated protein
MLVHEKRYAVKYLFYVALAAYACTASAAEYEFKAPITKSQWVMTDQTRLMCRLVHEIPEYGKISFTSTASKNKNLYFNMIPAMESKNNYDVDVRAIAPNYRPGIPDNHLSVMKNYKYFSGELKDQNAWTLTSALDRGSNLGFFFNDWYYQNQPVQVTVSSINFKKNFKLFTECMNNLLPYSFEDVAFTVITFDADTTDLTEESKNKLDRLITYLTYDPNVKELVIDSYSDSFGTTEQSRDSSAQRANMISSYIEQSNIPKNKIIKNAYGEKEHIASNATTAGRNVNRRVVITVRQNMTTGNTYSFSSDKELSSYGTDGVNDRSADSEEDITRGEVASKAAEIGRKPGQGIVTEGRGAHPSTVEMNSQAARDSNLPDLSKK